MSSAQGLASPRLATKSPGRIGFMPRLLVAAMPLMPSPLMQAPIFDLGALRLANIIVALALFSFLGTLMERTSLRRLDTLQRRALWVFAAYLLLFVVAFVRSFPNLQLFTAVFPNLFGTAVLPYVNYEFIAPLLYAFSFVYVLVLVRSPEDLLEFFSSIAVGVALQALVVVYCFIENPQILSGDDRFGISGITDDVLGMHYNDVAATYILTGPLLLYLALKRGGAWIAPYVLSIVAVLLLESRTGIFVFGATSFVTLLAVGGARISVWWIVAAVGGCIVVLGNVLSKLLSTGISGPHGFSLYFLLSGRLEKIWTPLLAEWLSTPQLFWFGAGEYGMLTSRILASGLMLLVAEAHNAYLEFFLDNGIVLFALFTAALLVLMFMGWRFGRRIRSGLYWSLFICIVGFLASCFSGRRFFPQPENAMIFPVLAALVCAARLKLAKMQAVAQ
jgi:hypothetical protein